MIGGGDWSEDRLLPDCIKSWSKGKKANIRNPHSTRPWQHVLEAISGYIISSKTEIKHQNSRRSIQFWTQVKVTIILFHLC